jgi:replicative DNA helicase
MSALANEAGEMAVLGAMLCHPGAVDAVADIAAPDDFTDPFLGHVFRLIVHEHHQGRQANPVTIRPLIDAEPGFAALGGARWLAGLTASPLTLLAAVPTARQLRDLAERRRLHAGLEAAIAAGADPVRPLADLVELADRAIAASASDDGGCWSAADVADMVIGNFDAPADGVLCGTIPSLDALLGPLRPGKIVILAGRPGMAKSATALSYSLGAAARGHGTLFVSLEMGAEELGERMLADLCLEHRVPYQAIRDRSLDVPQRLHLCRARERLAEMPLQILHKPGLTVARLRMLVRRWARRLAARGRKLELVVVDYLQLMRDAGGRDRFEAVTEISRSLKELSEAEGVVILALSQLSREVEKRRHKSPQLSDLRESGQLEQDADAVVFVVRHEQYLRRAAESDPADPRHDEWQEKMRRCAGQIEFSCAKRRYGEEGVRTGNFLAQYQAVRG